MIAMDSAACAARRSVSLLSKPSSTQRTSSSNSARSTVCAAAANNTKRPLRAAPVFTAGVAGRSLRVASRSTSAGQSRRSLAVHALPLSAEEVFNFENVAVFPLWLAMILAPNASITKRVLGSDLLFASLALIYAYLTVVSFQKPEILEGFSSGQPDLSALARAFSYPETVAVGWAHFIAQDLLVGRFIWVDGVKNKVFTAHSLILTLFFGPLGALSHIVTRAVAGKTEGDVLRLDPDEK